MRSENASPGLRESLRRLADTALASLQNRLALLGVELAEEKQRLFQGTAWAVLALVLFSHALTLLSGLLLLLFWEGHRITALALMGTGFMFAGIAAALLARYQLRRPGGLFSASLAELGHDREALKAGNK